MKETTDESPLIVAVVQILMTVAWLKSALGESGEAWGEACKVLVGLKGLEGLKGLGRVASK
jgi:hypothetical protein